MAASKRRKATPGARVSGRRKASAGASTPYRDLDGEQGEQVVRTRGEIDTRVADGQRLRDEIEARIEGRMSHAPARDVLSYDGRQ